MIETRRSEVLRMILRAFAVAVLCSRAQGKVIYVDDDARGGGDGTCWADAYVCLQDALGDARDSDKPVEIRVAQGGYTPDRGADQTLGDQGATFRLIKGVALRGGYAGLGAPDPDSRDVAKHQSVLSGDLAGDDVAVGRPLDLFDEPTRAENCSHVVSSSLVDQTAVLDGFAITAGGWGGMYNYFGSPTVIDCNFVENRSMSLGLGHYRQSAGEGAGVSNYGGSRPRMINCSFSRNAAHYCGGGMYNEGSDPTLIECTFTDNVIGSGYLPIALGADGGGMCNLRSAPRLTNCTFRGNSATRGGGMFNWSESSPVVTDCRFIGNVAQIGGGIGNLDSTAPMLTNCLFAGNLAQEGGGMSDDKGYPRLTNCTFVGNVSTCGVGSAIDCYLFAEHSEVWLTNCILWDGGEEIYALNTTISATYCNIQGGWPGEGNIDADPLFVDPGHWERKGALPSPRDDRWINGDYHLSSQAGFWDSATDGWIVAEVTSPCIDAGAPGSPTAFEPYPHGGRINMGAYGGTAEAGKSAAGHVKYGGGTGDPNTPYLIYTAEQMNEIGLRRDDWRSCFKLMADLDLSVYSGTQFNIIGSYPDPESTGQIPFWGVFDGNGHEIADFSYSSDNRLFVGLFDVVRGQIRDLGLVDPNLYAPVGRGVGPLASHLIGGTVSGCYARKGQVTGDVVVGGLLRVNWMGTVVDCNANATVTGNELVGGLMGENFGGSVSDSFSTGVTSGKDRVGGLVGANGGGTISGCYSAGVVAGVNRVGGLTGRNYDEKHYGVGAIADCYSLASVAGANDVGGFVGYNEQSNVTNCYSVGHVLGAERTGGLIGANSGDVGACFWDTDTSGQTWSAAGTGKTTSAMQTVATYWDAGWDFLDEAEDGTAGIWRLAQGWEYPRLRWEPEPVCRYGGGSGTPDDPYLIYTARQMNAIGTNVSHWDKHFKLMAHINLAAYTGTQFNIIGGVTEDERTILCPFEGVFDGNGFTISNFSFTCQEGDSIGLFGWIANSGTEIRNLGLLDPNVGVAKGYQVGSLVGCCDGTTLTNCYAEGARVSGRTCVGGLVGSNHGIMTECYSAGAVHGERRVGGLVGFHAGAAVTACSSAASVTGSSDVGGLVGLNHEVITDCYASGPVSGQENVGGLVGQNGEAGQTFQYPGTILNCYSCGSVSSETCAGGLVGLHASGTITASFWDTDRSGLAERGGGEGRTTEQMMTAETFLESDWDFETIWAICEHQGYPTLQWEEVVCSRQVP